MIHRVVQTALFTIAAMIVLAPGAAVAQILIGETSAQFNWTASTGDVEFYQVLVSRSSRGGNYELEQTVSGTSVVIDAGVGEVVRVRVMAGNSTTFSPLSAPSEAVRFGLPPELPVVGTAGVIHGRTSGGDSGFIFYSDPATGNVWEFSADVASAPATLIGTTDTNWELAASGDFDGDGFADLFFVHPSGATRIWFLNPGSYQEEIGASHLGATWIAEITGDFDGNGQDDIIWRPEQGEQGTVQAWFRMEAEFATAAFPSMSADTVELLTAGDFDGDGVDDLFWRDLTTTDTIIWLMAIDPYNGAYALTRVSEKRSMLWEVFETQDENGDGIEDVRWRLSDSHDVTQWWFMDSESVTTQ